MGSMSSIGDAKICILLVIKRCWQCKVYRESDLHHSQSEDASYIELFCLYQNVYNGEHKTFVQLINIQNCIKEKILIKLFMQCRNQ